MEAKRYLEQVEKIDKLITNKMAEAEKWRMLWEARATSTTAPITERVQSSGNQQKMADAIEKCVDIQNEIGAEIDCLIAKKKEIIKTIETLEPEEYDLLHKRYIQHMDLKEISLEYKRTYTWATTIHGRALKNVQDIISRRTQTKNYFK